MKILTLEDILYINNLTTQNHVGSPGIKNQPLLESSLTSIIIVVNSNVDWTIVRFMAPKNSPFTKEIKESFGDVKLNFSISREDIAYFMVKQVESTKYIHTMPIIGS